MQPLMRHPPGLRPRQHRPFLDNAAHSARVQAWTAFWQEQGDASRCLANAPPDARHALDGHWRRLAARLAPASRILDIGCGAGAVARVLLDAQGDFRIIGIDSARVPAPADRRIALLPETPMERLPFEGARFDAAVSQFGFEYGDVQDATEELARVLVPGAPVSFLVHHAHSSIVRQGRARNAALRLILGEAVKRSFLSGNAAELDRQIRPIQCGAPADALIGQVTQALRARSGRGRAQRSAVWSAVVEALGPEREMLAALEAACVAPGDLSKWLAGFSDQFEIRTASVVQRATGEVIAWKVEGVKAGASNL